jgi:cytochrome c553
MQKLLFLTGATLLVLFLQGCDSKETSSLQQSEPAKQEVQSAQETTPAPQNTSTPIETPSQDIEQINATEALPEEMVQKEVVDAFQSTQDEVAKKLEETNRKLAEKLAKTTKEGVKRIESALGPSAASTVPSEAPSSAAACASCHGKFGEKVALGKSKIISDMTSGEIKEALIGYKKGTYGREMKTLMSNQVKNLSDKTIEDLADFYGKTP